MKHDRPHDFVLLVLVLLLVLEIPLL